jgi:hypothetical protein
MRHRILAFKVAPHRPAVNAFRVPSRALEPKSAMLGCNAGLFRMEQWEIIASLFDEHPFE